MKRILLIIVAVILFTVTMARAIEKEEIEVKIQEYTTQLQQEQTQLKQFIEMVELRKANINRLNGALIALRGLLETQEEATEEVKIEKD